MNIPDIAIINIRPRFMLVSAVGMGIGDHEISDRDNAIMGDRVKSTGEDWVGLVVSFMISFRPSAMG